MMNELFGNKGFESNGILHLVPRDAYELCMKGAVLMDVREEYMNRYKMFDVPEVIYCPLSILEENVENLPAGKPLIFADAAGLHSKEAALLLIGKGLGQYIANLAGGLVEWEHDGLPLIIDKSEKLSGACMCQLKPRDKK